MPHIHEKVDFTAEVFIVHNNRVLLRQHDKYKLWLSVGGHIELDEDPNQAAVREVKEETGYEITVLSDHPAVFSEIRREEQKQIILFAYSAIVTSGTVDTSDDGVGEVRWFSYEEIDFSETLPFTKEMIDAAFPSIKEKV